MSLKIIRYRNYGRTMGSDPNFISSITKKRDKNTNEFFWIFFELNNGKIISMHFVENLKNNKLNSTDMFCNYTSHYKFEEDFYLWWDRDIKNIDDTLVYITEDEETLVKNFFKENIEKTRNILTKVINLI